MGHIHLTRREILQSLPVLGSGALLRPLRGGRPDRDRRDCQRSERMIPMIHDGGLFTDLCFTVFS